MVYDPRRRRGLLATRRDLRWHRHRHDPSAPALALRHVGLGCRDMCAFGALRPRTSLLRAPYSRFFALPAARISSSDRSQYSSQILIHYRAGRRVRRLAAGFALRGANFSASADSFARADAARVSPSGIKLLASAGADEIKGPGLLCNVDVRLTANVIGAVSLSAFVVHHWRDARTGAIP